MMTISNTTFADIDLIFELYNAATDYQKKLTPRHWKGFERTLIEREIEEGRHWKILDDGILSSTFVITYNDKIIWGEKDADPSVYIHRIATHPDFRGRSYVKHIVDWAIAHSQSNNRSFIRMDTGSGNQKLNDYYISCGFAYLGIVQLGDAGDLPLHYQNGSFSLFEMTVQEAVISEG